MNTYTLITGASSGIGKATAMRLAQAGRNLILIARREEKLQKIKHQLKDSTVDAIVKVLDVTQKSAVEKFFQELQTKNIDAVINNAGAAFGRDHLHEAQDEDLQAMIDLDITAFLRVARLSIPHLQKTQGHLITLGSIAGLETYEGGITYCGTKAFVHAASKGLRMELLGTGIRVTEIAPGAVETEFSTVRFKGDTNRANTVYEGYEPLRAEDVAEAIWFALSRPKHVNIQHLLIMPTAQASATRIAKN